MEIGDITVKRDVYLCGNCCAFAGNTCPHMGKLTYVHAVKHHTADIPS